MSNKIKVGIIFGGKSAEHEVSIRSAQSIVAALDKNKYESVLIKIERNGKWLLGNEKLLNAHGQQSLPAETHTQNVTLKPESRGELVSANEQPISTIDIAFPILHGPFGEDGTVQGLLKLAGIPFVGASVLGSAVGMDKDIMKRLLKEANIPVGKFITIRDGEKPDYDYAAQTLGSPLFVKPANLGSSVGVHKVTGETEFETAIADAFQYDHKVLVEEYIPGREIECSVLGNESPIASVPGEIIPTHDFYSYEAKYTDEHGAILKVPAELPPETTAQIQKLAVRTFQTLCCEGLARVDFFLKPDGTIFVNEINTLPGFTSISMYPKLWEASGLPYSQLIDRLVELAIARFNKEQKLLTSYSANDLQEN